MLQYTNSTERLTRIAVIQKTHRHPNVASTTPPKTGPNVGPSIVPREKQAIGGPLMSTGYISAIIAPPSDIGPPPKSPARRRNPMSISKLLENAQARVESKNMTMQSRKRPRRPQISETGPITRGPKQKPRM